MPHADTGGAGTGNTGQGNSVYRLEGPGPRKI